MREKNNQLCQDTSTMDGTAFGRLKEDIGDEATETIQHFLNSIPKRLSDMAQAIAANDYQGCRNLSHALMRDSRQLGARTLENLCHDLERISARNDFRVAWSLLEIIEEEAARTQETLMRLMQEP